MGLAPAPWPLCCFALHVAEQTDFLLGPVSVSPVVIERLNWHLGWPPPPAQISGLRGAGQLAGVPAGQRRGAGRGEASLSEAGAQGALRALRLALPVRAASGGRREHPGSAVSQEELACCPPLPRERQGPFRSLPRLPAPPAGGDGRSWRCPNPPLRLTASVELVATGRCPSVWGRSVAPLSQDCSSVTRTPPVGLSGFVHFKESAFSWVCFQF